jgi:hypothetical protein
MHRTDVDYLRTAAGQLLTLVLHCMMTGISMLRSVYYYLYSTVIATAVGRVCACVMAVIRFAFFTCFFSRGDFTQMLAR